MANNENDCNSEKIIKMFTEALCKKEFKGIVSLANGSDLFICVIPDAIKAAFRNGFDIDIEEELLWARDTSFWNNRNQGLVITDRGFHFIPDNDDADSNAFISWNNIEMVEYKDLTFIFYTHDGNKPQCGYNFFFKEANDEPKFKRALKSLADLFTKIATSVGYEEEKDFWDIVEEKINSHEYEEARRTLNEALDSANIADVMLTNMYLGESYLAERNELFKKQGVEIGTDNACLFRFDDVLKNAGYDPQQIDAALISTCKRLEKKAVSCYEKAIKIVNDDEELYDDKDKAVMLSSMHHDLARVAPTIERARTYIIEGLDADSGENFAEENYKTLTTEIANGDVPFTERYQYKDRRFMFVVNDYNSIAGCYDKEENIPWVFTLKDIPADVKFPVGHPQAKTLYIGHPLKPNVYIPFENATEQLFMEKIRELTYLAQCLGATEVKFRRVKGLDFSSSRKNAISAEGSAGRKFVNVEGGGKLSSNSTETYKANDTVEHVQTYNPIKPPFCPEELVWLSSDASCQAMVKSRLNGNMLNYTERISSSEATTVSSSQLVSIKGSFEYLLAKASGSREVKGDNTFSKATETEWEVSIKFKPLEEFGAPQPASAIEKNGAELTDAERQYKEEVGFCLEDDGKIDEQERMFLERKRIKLGISEERAQQIEATLNTAELAANEQEYIDMVKDFMIDGAIPDSARRVLARERKSLNLSDERAEELENLALNGDGKDSPADSLTDDEKDFISCLNDVVVDGNIPENARRLINRAKTSLGISDERAAELEEIALNNKA